MKYYTDNLSWKPSPIERAVKKKEKSYSWKGTPNAGIVLGAIAVLWALSIVISGFIYH
ncbi:MAG: hypothetical protein WCA07_17000 [Gloeobacterales cyanobacterium]